MAGTNHVDIGLLHQFHIANHGIAAHMPSCTRVLLVAVYAFEFHCFAIYVKYIAPDFNFTNSEIAFGFVRYLTLAIFQF